MDGSDSNREFASIFIARDVWELDLRNRKPSREFEFVSLMAAMPCDAGSNVACAQWEEIASHLNQASGSEDDVLNLELKNILSSNGIDMREDLRNQIAIGR
jgi:hypothetical protein